MAKRKTIGLIFSYSEEWIGGSYYIINIIKSLNFLPDAEKPVLIILSYKLTDFDVIKELKYPYIRYTLIENAPLPVWKNFVNRVSHKLIKKYIFQSKNQFKRIEVLFPGRFDPIFDSVKNKIFWIPDFQERYLPQFFKPEEIQQREDWQNAISKGKHLVFSSKNALEDFNKFYPDSLINRYVFNFSSILPQMKYLPLGDLLKKYQLDSSAFFFSANQFWEHKNHIVILKAVKKLKEAGKLDFSIYFSGKESDYRNPDYFNGLKEFVINNQLEKYIRFLGFIDRTDQLSFMHYSMGIIQPSLFEGWSTVIEDAKALNQNIIVSNINVHKEQLDQKAFYFDPYDEDELIEQVEKVKHFGKKQFDFKYAELIKESGTNFMNIINRVTSTGK